MIRAANIVARALLTLGAALLAPSVVIAQTTRFVSEHGTVSQRVQGTTITIEYDRPTARGRTLFGDSAVIKWGEVWTPGANWATTIDVDRDVTIEGRHLPKGKYSLWLTPQPSGDWSLLVAKTARRFHTRLPPADDEQLRVPVKPEQGMHMEALAWYFPGVTTEGTTLRMHWGTTMVPIQIGLGRSPPLR